MCIRDSGEVRPTPPLHRRERLYRQRIAPAGAADVGDGVEIVQTSIVAGAGSLGHGHRTVGDRIVYDHMLIQERGPLAERQTEPGHGSTRDGDFFGVPRKPTSRNRHNT